MHRIKFAVIHQNFMSAISFGYYTLTIVRMYATDYSQLTLYNYLSCLKQASMLQMLRNI